jgi:hypothetical protein
VIEVKSVVPDNQAMLVSLDRKVRLAGQLAAERGWTCSRVARFLVIANSRTTRRRIARHAALFELAFPVRTWAALAWLKNPTDPAPPPSCLSRSHRLNRPNSGEVGRRA